MNQKKDNLIWVGTFVNTHGVKGEIRILTNSNESEKIFSKGSLLKFIFNNEIQEFIITSYRIHKQFILVKFKGVNNINEIEYLKGCKIYINKKRLNNDEYYLSDLKNKIIFDQNNINIGIIIDIIDQGPYDSLIVKLNDGSKTNIPIVDDFKIKFDNKKVNVNLPDGFINNDKN